MKKPSWKTYALWIVGVEAVGALSGFLTRDGAESYSETIRQPPLSPPAIVFPIVWGILFLLLGVSAARIYGGPASPNRTRALRIFAVQLAIKFFWSIIFFHFQNFGAAFLWLNGVVGANFADDFRLPQGRSAGRVVTGTVYPVGNLCSLLEFQCVDAQPVTKQDTKRIRIAGTFLTEQLNQWGENTEDRNMARACCDPLCVIKSVAMNEHT